VRPSEQFTVALEVSHLLLRCKRPAAGYEFLKRGLDVGHGQRGQRVFRFAQGRGEKRHFQRSDQQYDVSVNAGCGGFKAPEEAGRKSAAAAGDSRTERNDVIIISLAAPPICTRRLPSARAHISR
jgi:hypothetical protein